MSTSAHAVLISVFLRLYRGQKLYYGWAVLAFVWAAEVVSVFVVEIYFLKS